MQTITTPKTSEASEIQHICVKNKIPAHIVYDFEYPTTEPPTRMYPSDKIVAIVVDILQGGGKISVYKATDKATDKFIGSVGNATEMDELTIIPWKHEWWFYSIGNVRIRQVMKG